MVNRYFSVMLFLLISVYGFSLSIGVEGGVSYFEYAEVSSNNKDDLFKITAITGGISIGDDRLANFLGVQVPLNLYFEDALGADDKNYIYDFVYFGINDKLSYTFLDMKFYKVKFLISANYFILRDHIDMEITEYDFLTIGPGLGLDLNFKLGENLKFYLNGETTLNFPLFFRWDKKFLWSYSGYINTGFLYLF